MTHDQKFITIRAMGRYGGSFVKSLAETYLIADEDNASRIEAAFPEYMEMYGPGGAMFEAMSKVEA